MAGSSGSRSPAIFQIGFINWNGLILFVRCLSLILEVIAEPRAWLIRTLNSGLVFSSRTHHIQSLLPLICLAFKILKPFSRSNVQMFKKIGCAGYVEVLSVLFLENFHHGRAPLWYLNTIFFTVLPDHLLGLTKR